MNTLSKQQCPPLALAIVKVRVAAAAALLAHGRGLHSVRFSAQLRRFLWDRGCI
jgi:hypothetical protein